MLKGHCFVLNIPCSLFASVFSTTSSFPSAFECLRAGVSNKTDPASSFIPGFDQCSWFSHRLDNPEYCFFHYHKKCLQDRSTQSIVYFVLKTKILVSAIFLQSPSHECKVRCLVLNKPCILSPRFRPPRPYPVFPLS